MASPTTFPLGPGQANDNLTGLAAGACKSLGQIGTGSVIFDLVIAPMTFRTGAAAAYSIDIYLAMSEGTTNWTDGINPNALTDQSALIRLARKIWSVPVTSGLGTYRSDGFSVASVLGFMPMYACVLIQNNTGVAFDPTAGNFAAQYSTQVYQTPALVVYG